MVHVLDLYSSATFPTTNVYNTCEHLRSPVPLLYKTFTYNFYIDSSRNIFPLYIVFELIVIKFTIENTTVCSISKYFSFHPLAEYDRFSLVFSPLCFAT